MIKSRFLSELRSMDCDYQKCFWARMFCLQILMVCEKLYQPQALQKCSPYRPFERLSMEFLVKSGLSHLTWEQWEPPETSGQLSVSSQENGWVSQDRALPSPQFTISHMRATSVSIAIFSNVRSSYCLKIIVLKTRKALESISSNVPALQGEGLWDAGELTGEPPAVHGLCTSTPCSFP